MAPPRKRQRVTGGTGGWITTFADLATLLMAFFVMIVSFSVQDTQKVNQAAGSIRDAFGIKLIQRPAGMIERDGVPVRDLPRNVGIIDPVDEVEFATELEDSRQYQGPEANTHDFEIASRERPSQFLAAAEALRQTLADMPDVAEISRNIQMEEDETGLHLRILDRDGRSMFAENSSIPNPTLTRLLSGIAPVLQQLPNRVRISGHTSAGSDESGAGVGGWRLSASRAIGAADVMTSSGLRDDHLESVIGKGDSDPLFPNDPFLSANRRIEITLIREAPPFPVDLNR